MLQELKNIVGAGALLCEEPLSLHTTFKIGGPAQYFVSPSTEEQIQSIVRACCAAGVPWRILGLGSNVLAPDEGLPGVIIHCGSNFAKIEQEGETLIAQSGASNKDVAEFACAAGLRGYEFASGIPGTIGGAAIMNAGAYDGCFADVAREVRCLTPEGDIVQVPASEAQWGYRTSLMMQKNYVVLSATLSLRAGDREESCALIDDLTRRREEKQPLEMPSAGSAFKRPEGHYAGQLIQDAGLMGYSVGGAQVSTKHAGFIVNTGGATAADVLQLVQDIQQRVYETSGVKLEPEVRLWS